MKGLPDPVRRHENYFAAYPQIENHAYYSVQLGNIYLITLDSSTFLVGVATSVLARMPS